MSEAIFWGEKGEYGPFTVQEDGWPNAGEVIRHYRKKRKMSAEDLAQQYSEGTGEQVTARWILKMEQQNKIPVDITRRRILMKILDIPPTLLGLASLSQIAHTPTGEITQKPSILQRNISTLDVAKYDQQARDRWLLSYTGKEDSEEIIASINVLEVLERQSSGEALKYIREVLNSHYQLASDIARHQGDFATAYHYANNAVRVTKLVGVYDFVAAALYRRGYTNLERGIFGDRVLVGRINHEPNKKQIEQAIVDFEEALLHARPQLKGAIWLELSRAQGIVQNTTISLRLLGQAENKVDAGSILADPVEQILLEGALNGLSEGMYLLGKAASLIVLGRTTTATEILDDLEELKNGKRIVRNQTRRLAYADLLRAEAALGTRDYIASASRATSALQTFQDIHTVERIAWINDIYSKLVGRYGNQSEVKVLGKMLSDYYKGSQKLSHP